MSLKNNAFPSKEPDCDFIEGCPRWKLEFKPRAAKGMSELSKLLSKGMPKSEEGKKLSKELEDLGQELNSASELLDIERKVGLKGLKLCPICPYNKIEGF
jgi:hypothetical protein